MIVEMPEEMMRHAARVGIERQLRALRLGRRHRHGWDGADDWAWHIHAACAERAVAWVLDRDWDDTPDPDYAGDVGAGVQVRWTARTAGCLLLHPDDDDHHHFFLVRGRIERLELAGWITASDGKRPGFWRTRARDGTPLREPAFFVPAELLRPVPDRRAAAA